MRLKSKVKTVPYRPKKARAIDVDKKSRLKAGLTMLKVYFNAIAMGKTGVKVMRSATGGYHVYADGGFTRYEALVLGDCKGRLSYWEKQGYTFTFHRKMTSKNITIGIERETSPLYLPFFVVKEIFKRRSEIWRMRKEKGGFRITRLSK